MPSPHRQAAIVNDGVSALQLGLAELPSCEDPHQQPRAGPPSPGSGGALDHGPPDPFSHIFLQLRHLRTQYTRLNSRADAAEQEAADRAVASAAAAATVTELQQQLRWAWDTVVMERARADAAAMQAAEAAAEAAKWHQRFNTLSAHTAAAEQTATALRGKLQGMHAKHACETWRREAAEARVEYAETQRRTFLIGRGSRRPGIAARSPDHSRSPRRVPLALVKSDPDGCAHASAASQTCAEATAGAAAAVLPATTAGGTVLHPTKSQQALSGSMDHPRASASTLLTSQPRLVPPPLPPDLPPRSAIPHAPQAQSSPPPIPPHHVATEGLHPPGHLLVCPRPSCTPPAPPVATTLPPSPRVTAATDSAVLALLTPLCAMTPPSPSADAPTLAAIAEQPAAAAPPVPTLVEAVKPPLTSGTHTHAHATTLQQAPRCTAPGSGVSYDSALMPSRSSAPEPEPPSAPATPEAGTPPPQPHATAAASPPFRAHPAMRQLRHAQPTAVPAVGGGGPPHGESAQDSAAVVMAAAALPAALSAAVPRAALERGAGHRTLARDPRVRRTLPAADANEVAAPGHRAAPEVPRRVPTDTEHPPPGRAPTAVLLPHKVGSRVTPCAYTS